MPYEQVFPVSWGRFHVCHSSSRAALFRDTGKRLCIGFPGNSLLDVYDLATSVLEADRLIGMAFNRAFTMNTERMLTDASRVGLNLSPSA